MSSYNYKLRFSRQMALAMITPARMPIIEKHIPDYSGIRVGFEYMASAMITPAFMPGLLKKHTPNRFGL